MSVFFVSLFLVFVVHLVLHIDAQTGHFRTTSKIGRKNWRDAYFEQFRRTSKSYGQILRGIPRWQSVEVQGRTDYSEFTRCEVWDKKASECYRNRCYYCCSDRYCHPSKSSAPDCFNSCGSCRTSEDCTRDDCYFDSVTKRCTKRIPCELDPSNEKKDVCLGHGCHYCCTRRTCHTKPQDPNLCGKGCESHCFDKDKCLLSKECKYDSSRGVCSKNDGCEGNPLFKDRNICEKRGCFYCCSKTSCHTKSVDANVCGWGCAGHCFDKPTCLKSSGCDYDSLTDQCFKKTVCEFSSSSKDLCLKRGCHFCCSTMSCHTTPRDANVCSKGCAGHCFNETTCRENPTCKYDSLRSQCLEKDVCELQGSNKHACQRTSGCFYCCRTLSCSSIRPNVACNDGCIGHCFDERQCRRDTKECSYDSSSGQCLHKDDVKYCSYDNDLIVLVDESLSVGSPNFKYMKEFAAKLAKTWKLNPNNRVAVLKFGNDTTPVVRLNNIQTPEEIYTTVSNMKYGNAHLTLTAAAIKYSIVHHRVNRRPVPKNVVVVTDGKAGERSKVLKEQIEELKSNNISSFSVGVGSALDEKTAQAQLLLIAMDIEDRRAYVSDFEQLVDVLSKVSSEICKVSQDFYD